MVKLCKNGIHIKKSHQGRFTDYCGGKVTNECISRGKASSNPAVRKQATFAANARTWKHQLGGQLNGPTPESIADKIKRLQQEDQDRAQRIINQNIAQGQSLADKLNPIATAIATGVNGALEKHQLHKNAEKHQKEEAKKMKITNPNVQPDFSSITNQFNQNLSNLTNTTNNQLNSFFANV